MERMEVLVTQLYNGFSVSNFVMRKVVGGYKEVLDYFPQLRANGNYEEMKRLLLRNWGKAFGQKGLGDSFLTELAETMKVMDESKEAFIEKYEALLRKLKEIDSKVLSASQWKKLSGMLTANGLFKMGYVCREKAVQEILRNSKKTTYLLESFNAYMELADYERAGKQLNKLQGKWLFKKYCKETLELCENFYAILTHDKEKLQKNYQKAVGIEKEYYEFVEKNRVAIIGPAPGKTEDLEKIKELEATVRFNYRGKNTMDDNQKDITTGIAFYNTRCSRWVQKETDDKTFLDDVKFIVCKKGLNHCYPETQQDKIRNAIVINNTFLIGIPNGLPILMMDLCLCGKEQIEVYCNNLYLSKNVWTGNYNLHTKAEQKELFWWPVLAQHEMTSQFLFLQNMYKAGLIVADEELQWVLEHDVEDYISKMEELWVLDVIPYKMNVNWRGLK